MRQRLHELDLAAEVRLRDEEVREQGEGVGVDEPDKKGLLLRALEGEGGTQLVVEVGEEQALYHIKSLELEVPEHSANVFQHTQIQVALLEGIFEVLVVLLPLLPELVLQHSLVVLNASEAVVVPVEHQMVQHHLVEVAPQKALLELPHVQDFLCFLH